jgi:hypothetical protein
LFPPLRTDSEEWRREGDHGLLSTAAYLKDSRILPAGFDKQSAIKTLRRSAKLRMTLLSVHYEGAAQNSGILLAKAEATH